MPPKAKFDREKVIAAALEIVEERGIDALTARALGSRLGSSARPIFTLFDGMDEVYSCTVAAAKGIYAEYVKKGLACPIPFKGVGQSYIEFAARRPQLFRLLFMQGDAADSGGVLRGIEDNYASILDSVRQGYGLDGKSAEKLYFNLWVYTHGIATLVATGVCAFTAEEASELLTFAFRGMLYELRGEL